jgi:hypothetical protein
MNSNQEPKYLTKEQVMLVAIQMRDEKNGIQPKGAELERRLREIYKNDFSVRIQNAQGMKRILNEATLKNGWPPLQVDYPWSLGRSEELGVPNGHEELLVRLSIYSIKSGHKFTGRLAKWVTKISWMYGHPVPEEKYAALLLIATTYAGRERIAQIYPDESNTTNLDISLILEPQVLHTINYLKLVDGLDDSALQAIMAIDPTVVKSVESVKKATTEELNAARKNYELLESTGNPNARQIYEFWMVKIRTLPNYPKLTNEQRLEVITLMAKEITKAFKTNVLDDPRKVYMPSKRIRDLIGYQGEDNG